MLEIRERTTPHYPKNFMIAALLCLFFGLFGIHRFYTSYKRLGLAQLVIFCVCVVWWLSGFSTNNIARNIFTCFLVLWWVVDLLAICFNAYKDKYGNVLDDYNGTMGALVLTIAVITFFTISFAMITRYVM